MLQPLLAACLADILWTAPSSHFWQGQDRELELVDLKLVDEKGEFLFDKQLTEWYIQWSRKKQHSERDKRRE